MPKIQSAGIQIHGDKIFELHLENLKRVYQFVLNPPKNIKITSVTFGSSNRLTVDASSPNAFGVEIDGKSFLWEFPVLATWEPDLYIKKTSKSEYLHSIFELIIRLRQAGINFGEHLLEPRFIKHLPEVANTIIEGSLPVTKLSSYPPIISEFTVFKVSSWNDSPTFEVFTCLLDQCVSPSSFKKVYNGVLKLFSLMKEDGFSFEFQSQFNIDEEHGAILTQHAHALNHLGQTLLNLKKPGHPLKIVFGFVNALKINIKSRVVEEIHISGTFKDPIRNLSVLLENYTILYSLADKYKVKLDGGLLTGYHIQKLLNINKKLQNPELNLVAIHLKNNGEQFMTYNDKAKSYTLSLSNSSSPDDMGTTISRDFDTIMKFFFQKKIGIPEKIDAMLFRNLAQIANICTTSDCSLIREIRIIREKHKKPHIKNENYFFLKRWSPYYVLYISGNEELQGFRHLLHQFLK